MQSAHPAESEEATDEMKRYKESVDKVKEEFMCPITFDVMVDPVVASDGHSYERDAIQDVLDRGNDPRSPLTREALSRTLVPNVNLRQRIEGREGELDGMAAQFEARMQEVAAAAAATAAAEAAQLREELQRERLRRREEAAEGEEPEVARRVRQRRSRR